MSEPELFTIPEFGGCTNTNPDFCACNEGSIFCTACDDEIGEGEEVYALQVDVMPWTSGDPDKWEDMIWHARCDQRGEAA